MNFVAMHTSPEIDEQDGIRVLRSIVAEVDEARPSGVPIGEALERLYKAAKLSLTLFDDRGLSDVLSRLTEGADKAHALVREICGGKGYARLTRRYDRDFGRDKWIILFGLPISTDEECAEWGQEIIARFSREVAGPAMVDAGIDFEMAEGAVDGA